MPASPAFASSATAYATRRERGAPGGEPQVLPPVDRPARVRTRTDEVGARRAPVTPQAYGSGRPGSNGPLRSGGPALSLLSYVHVSTPGWSRTSVLRRRRAALLL